MSSPIDNYDTPGPVFTFADNTTVVVILFILACLAFIYFIAKVAMHESHAYAAIAAHEEPEPGPAVEGEPEVASV